MFDTENPSELMTLLDMFQVPMFAAERRDNGPFRLLTINRAHTALTSLEVENVQNLTIDALLPPKEADAVIERYCACCGSGAPLQYRETLTINGKISTWNTSLIPTVTADGCERVIGSAVVLEEHRSEGKAVMVFDDIAYFSVQAQFQLSHVSTLLDRVAESEAATLRACDLKALAGLCRSVDISLNEIRDRAEPRIESAVTRLPRALVRDSPASPNKCARDREQGVSRSIMDLSLVLGRLH